MPMVPSCDYSLTVASAFQRCRILQSILVYLFGSTAMRFLTIIILALMSVGQAAAAEIFTNNTMFMRVQCEIGEFAKDAKSSGLDPAMKADVDFSWTVEKSTNVKAS